MNYVFLLILLIIIVMFVSQNTNVKICLMALIVFLLYNCEKFKQERVIIPQPYLIMKDKYEDTENINTSEKFSDVAGNFSDVAKHFNLNDKMTKQQLHIGSQAKRTLDGRIRNPFDWYSKKGYIQTLSEDAKISDELEWWNNDRNDDLYDMINTK